MRLGKKGGAMGLVIKLIVAALVIGLLSYIVWKIFFAGQGVVKFNPFGVG